MLGLIVYVILITNVSAKSVVDERVPLIIFGVDGFSYQYYLQYGNKTSGDSNIFPIQPVFPTKTFPNFMSIATGLYPTQHGIVNNAFYNQKRNLKFRYGDTQNEDFDWFKGEPIWITAKKAGLRSYIDTWVGSGADYGGLSPDIQFGYRVHSFEQTVQGLVENMDGDYRTRCDLYMLYSNEPDHSLHENDNTDEETVQEIIDAAEKRISLLKSALGNRKYNLILTSDHGMTGHERRYQLPKLLRDKARLFYQGEVPWWYSKQNRSVAEDVRDLNRFLQSSGMTGLSAVETAALDNRFQMCGLEGEGLPDIIFMGDDGVVVSSWAWDNPSGGHGYDNTFPKMYAHARVSGPGFREVPGVEDRPLKKTTELYNLFCSLLGIKPANNTGGLNTFDFLLSHPPDRTEWEASYSRVQAPCD